MRRGMLLAISLILMGTVSAAGQMNAYMLAIVPGAAIITVVLVAGAQMLGNALSMPAAVAWSKEELRELLAGVILIVIVQAAVFGTDAVAGIITGTGDVNKAAGVAVDSMLKNATQAYRSDILLASRMTSLAAYSNSYSLPLWFFGFGYSNGMWGGYRALLGAPNAAAQGLTNALFFYTGAKTFLKFFEVAVPVFILPMGYAFRLLPFTRKAGGTLIALALGAYIMFPVSILLVGEMHKNISMPDTLISSADLGSISLEIPGSIQTICESTALRLFIGLNEIGWWLVIGIPASIPCLMGFFGCLMAWYSIIVYLIYPLANTIGTIAFSLVLLLSAPDVSASTAYEVAAKFLKQANNLVVLSYIDAIVIAIVTYIGSKGISSAIGGEGYMMGIQRLV